LGPSKSCSEPGFIIQVSLYRSVHVLRSVEVWKLPKLHKISSVDTKRRPYGVNSETWAIFQDSEDLGTMHDRLESSQG
jgi:hypothetical protein